MVGDEEYTMRTGKQPWMNMTNTERGTRVVCTRLANSNVPPGWHLPPGSAWYLALGTSL